MKSRIYIIIIIIFVGILGFGIFSLHDKAPVENNEESKTEPLIISNEKEINDNSIEESSDSMGSHETDIGNEIEKYLSNMTLEEKVAQMFIVLPESIIEGVDCVTAAGEMTKNAIDDIPVGGFVYSEANLVSYEQTGEMLQNVQQYSMNRTNLPMFLCVDEEGGTVARVSGNSNFNVPVIDDMAMVGERGDGNEAYEIGVEIGTYLNDLGFNVDFAPVVDVLTNSENQVVKKRSFGEDPDIVARMAAKLSEGLKDTNVLYTYKHFPGHGNTSADTHAGYAYSEKSLEELYDVELIPFKKGIEEGVPLIMTGHISLPNVTGSDIPASLSYRIVTEILREDLGYEGIIITDALNMGAIVQQYSSSEAAVMAIEAGNDMILMPADFHEAYSGIISAVQEGRISEERIDESLSRIVKEKLLLSAADKKD